MKIVSMLPSATEILYFLGAWEDVVAVSEECDYPPEARRKPKAMHCIIDCTRLTSEEIDRAISRLYKERGTLYEADEALLLQLQPDVIISQELCEVCSITPNQFQSVLIKLQPKVPRVISVNPKKLDDILDNILEIAEAIGRRDQGLLLVSQCEARLESVRRKIPAGGELPRVFFMEWLDPIYNSGHWVPEMLERSGGIPVLAHKGEPSSRIPLEQLLEVDPDIIVMAPCGYTLERTIQELSKILDKEAWSGLRAFQNRQVYLTYETFFAKPGPRVVDGVEILAEILHPELDFGHRQKKDFSNLLDVPSLARNTPSLQPLIP